VEKTAITTSEMKPVLQPFSEHGRIEMGSGLVRWRSKRRGSSDKRCGPTMERMEENHQTMQGSTQPGAFSHKRQQLSSGVTFAGYNHQMTTSFVASQLSARYRTECMTPRLRDWEREREKNHALLYGQDRRKTASYDPCLMGHQLSLYLLIPLLCILVYRKRQSCMLLQGYHSRKRTRHQTNTQTKKTNSLISSHTP